MGRYAEPKATGIGAGDGPIRGAQGDGYRGGYRGERWKKKAAPAMLSPMSAADGGRRPNIILIITDQQRYETIGALGYPHVDTPHLDGWCARA